MVARRCISSRYVRTPFVGLLLAVLSLPGTVAGSDRDADSAAGGERRISRIRLDRERLVPRVSVELESLSTFDREVGVGRQLRDHVLFDQLSRNVRRRATRVTRRALRDHLFEAINLDRGISALRGKTADAASPSRNVRVHVGIHSRLPEVGLGYRLGRGSAMRWTVGADGDVGVKWNSDRLEHAEFSANFDGEDEFTVRARLAF